MLKHRVPDTTIYDDVNAIAEECTVSAVALSTVEKAWAIRKRYHLSYWDSLIVAAALETDSTILYSEDLQHGQIIEQKMTIVNPFSLAG